MTKRNTKTYAVVCGPLLELVQTPATNPVMIGAAALIQHEAREGTSRRYDDCVQIVSELEQRWILATDDVERMATELRRAP